MTEHDLKELTNLGAELGAAKAEVDRLRGLLEEVHPYVSGCSSDLWQRCHAALSQQAGPAETTEACTAVDMATAAAQGFRDGQAAVEQAVAQDEREASRSVEPIVRALNASVAVGSDGDWVSIRREHRDAAVRMLSDLDADFRHVYQAYAEAQKRANRLAQAEQRPEQSVAANKLRALAEIWDQNADEADEFGNAQAAEALRLAAFELRATMSAPQGKFSMGDLVKKSTGSEWEGRVVGTYSTEQTPEGYAVESSAHRNSVQIYPAKALEAVE